MRGSGGALLGAIVLAGALAGAGCRAMEPVAIPFVYEHDPPPGLVENVFPVLLSGWTEHPARDETRGYILWPFLHYVREGPETYIGFLGADLIRCRVDHRGFEDFDYNLFPVLYGHSHDEGSYFAIFPFGGTLKGLLGKSYAHFVLFPVYLYAEDNRGVGPAGDIYKSRHVLFPFVSWVEGGGRSGFKIFPFYSHFERETYEGKLASERTWILWPFWTSVRENIDLPERAMRLWFLFPFYGRSDSKHVSQWTVLWPFLRWYENRGSFGGGPYWQFRFWPFVTVAEGRDRSQLDIWPFYGTKTRLVDLTTGEAGAYSYYDRTFVLWPLFRRELQESDVELTSRLWVLPLVWTYDTTYKKTGGRKYELKVWPLFRYKEWPDGRLTVNLLSPLWFNDPEGAFEMIYNPLFRIYERSRKDGWESRLYAWGLVQSHESERRETFAVHPFLYWDDVAKDDSEADYNLLFGLFQYTRRGKERALRFFWLPEWPTWEAD